MTSVEKLTSLMVLFAPGVKTVSIFKSRSSFSIEVSGIAIKVPATIFIFVVSQSDRKLAKT